MKKAKKPVRPLAGAAYRKAAGLVGTVVYTTAGERDRARRAAGELGVSLQEFARGALAERAKQVLSS